MPYTKRARRELREQLGYEFWLLDYLIAQSRTLRGLTGRLSLRVENNGGTGAAIGLGSITMGSDLALEVISKVRLLAFLACYKVMDTTFEWILAENLGTAPRRFDLKLSALQQSGLRYPREIARRTFIPTYFAAMYQNLTEYRHEVVHRHGGELLKDGIVRIHITQLPSPAKPIGAPLGTLELVPHQVEAPCQRRD